jgi:hypothetical protein
MAGAVLRIAVDAIAQKIVPITPRDAAWEAPIRQSLYVSNRSTKGRARVARYTESGGPGNLPLLSNAHG